ncbi:MAG: winged helix DNA-binding domain-containing protein [Gordonia sp. (in: high G+C Gram-positive bacteria)]|uniref:winged helix DNA-binding domain-containing protein n=1 Tax=Gordonia sp. (in: high G+C Gram-positive bacteria) TaxID=84139 RepID=UPI003BB794CC
MPEQITVEQWNRTLLERQHLLDRVGDDAIEVIDRCVGLQAQDPQAPFFALASRVDGFAPAELDALLSEREVVRMVLQRGTLFAMDALDARWIRAAVQPAIEASTLRTHRAGLGEVEPGAVAETARGLFVAAGDSGVSVAALRLALARAWPTSSIEALAAVVRAWLPLVQLPPRGLWRQSGGPTLALLDDWIGAGEPAVDGEEARKDLIRMYLRGYGPASGAAIAAWSGLTGLGPLLEAMEADWELAALTGPAGQRLYDLEGLSIADPSAPAPVRLLAPYDGFLVANADRERVADAAVYRATVTRNGRSPGFVLVDGRLVGTWRLTDGGVELAELVDLAPRQRAAVESEVAALTAFVDG